MFTSQISPLLTTSQLTSVHLSSELSGREATQFALAATNQNAVDRASQIKSDIESIVKTVVTWRRQVANWPSNKPFLIGRSHGELADYGRLVQMK